MREKIESKPVPNPLDKPSWERVRRGIGALAGGQNKPHKRVKTKKQSNIVSRLKSNYSGILTANFDLTLKNCTWSS